MEEQKRQEIWFRRAYLSGVLKNIIADKLNSGEKFTDGQMKLNKLVNEDVPTLLDEVVFLEGQVEKQANLAETWHNAYKEKRKVEERLRKELSQYR